MPYVQSLSHCRAGCGVLRKRLLGRMFYCAGAKKERLGRSALA